MSSIYGLAESKTLVYDPVFTQLPYDPSFEHSSRVGRRTNISHFSITDVGSTRLYCTRFLSLLNMPHPLCLPSTVTDSSASSGPDKRLSLSSTSGVDAALSDPKQLEAKGLKSHRHQSLSPSSTAMERLLCLTIALASLADSSAMPKPPMSLQHGEV